MVFAPQIRAVQPAFIYDKNSERKVKIYFSLPLYNSGDINAIKYIITDPNKISTWGTNKIQEGEITSWEESETSAQEYYFSITIEEGLLVVNQFYQIQIWFKNTKGILSAASQVSLIRPIPSLTVEFDQSDSVYNFSKLSGRIKETNSNSLLPPRETLESYSCTIGTWNSPVIFGNGDKFIIPIDNQEIQEGPKYSVKFKYTTIHGYQGEQDVDITYKKPSSPGGPVIDSISKNLDRGSITITASRSGIVQRALEGIDYWWDLAEIGSSWTDFTIESDVNYRYRIVDSTRATSGNVQNISLSFEDIYLSNEETMVVVKFNPNISNFKYVVQESVMNTLGGKYPIIRKNGDTKYRQFNLSGSIFIEGSVVIQNTDDSANNNKITDINKLFVDEYCLYSIKNNPLNATDNTPKEAVETRGRRMVMDFLCDNKPKLFRSAEEGNMIVYLSNISFTPNRQLGRHIYDFSATVSEICDYTMENLAKYKLNLGGYTPATVICQAKTTIPVTVIKKDEGGS